MVFATPVALAVVYGVVVLAHLGSIVGGIYLASDAAIAPMLAHLAPASPAGASVVLGNHAWYEEYLFMRATASLPGYRAIWELAPILWSLGGLAALGWAA